MIFLDTSAAYAIADSADPNHDHASDWIRSVLQRHETVLTHNYAVIESVALIQRRLGLQAALVFIRGTGLLRVHWVTRDEHQMAVDLLEQRDKLTLSLVDCVSFVVMRALNVSAALAYDSDFEREGFTTSGSA